ncbi:MAG: hypothetical protein MRY57_02115 [Candidatus Pacebacteria bacterium]|nr:hypothetical protein [Candidatus Paceibacterota bacterium]
MENLEYNAESKNPKDLLYEEIYSLNSDLRSLKKDMGYEGELMMFLLGNKDVPLEVKEEGLKEIEQRFDSEPEVIDIKNKISEIENKIQEIDNSEKQEKIDSFPEKKKLKLDKINDLHNKYQSQYERYEVIRKKLATIFEEKIQPGIDVGMDREIARRTYVNGTEYNGYPDYIKSIERINTRIADAILNLEITLEEVKDLEVENMNKLDKVSSTQFLLRDVKDEYFQNEVKNLEERLDRLEL